MYQHFFNFNSAPFSIAPDPHFIFMSEHHQEGLAHLLYGINQGGGFVALTGEVGTGKTTLCHCLLQQLPDNIDIALVLNPKLNAIELLATVCDELQIPYNQDKQTLKGLIDSLNKHLIATHASGRRTVLMIDEAQNLSLDVLEQIRLLTNLETSKTKLLQIILIGQPELKKLLEQPDLRQLNQRITARYHLTSLSFSETDKYIKHRLSISGSNSNIFSRKAIRKVFKLSKGIPRLINILCDRALLGAYVGNKKSVTTKIIDQSAKEVFNADRTPFKVYLKYTFLGFIVLASMVLTMQYLVSSLSPKKHVILSGSFGRPVAEKPKVIVQKQVPVVLHKKVKQPQPPEFNSLIKQQTFSINTATSRLAHLWNKKIQPGSSCEELRETGLNCLFDKTDWKGLIALNRPVILEFAVTESEKFYAILIGLKQDNPFFYFNPELSFPVEQILALWDGYYLMLWQSPVQNINAVYPGQSSAAVLWIRKQFLLNQNYSPDTLNSDFFDNGLKTEVIKFQLRHHLITDGIVGPRTFIHLNNNDSQNNSPKLKLSN